MALLKFSIVNDGDSIQTTDESNMLINLDHIVSVKPIKISRKDKHIIDGFWLRLSNGKKYKASRIPDSVKEVFNESLPSININDEATHNLNLQ